MEYIYKRSMPLSIEIYILSIQYYNQEPELFFFIILETICAILTQQRQVLQSLYFRIL
ncbi:hypothetical protein pb186bvf_003171 [Paramecium bursaria]